MIELFRNLTFKIQGRSHSSRSNKRNNILSTHTPFNPCWSALPFLRCSYLKNWPWKSKVKGEVKVQSHQVSLTSYRLTSLWFHVNRPSHSRDTAFLAATKQLYDWFSPSVRLSVRLSHFFHHVPIIVSSWNFQELLPWSEVMSMQKVKVKGQGHKGQHPT